MRPRILSPIAAGVVAALACACGARPSPRAPEATGEAGPEAPPLPAEVRGVSTAPVCGRPDEPSGICQVSEGGVTVQGHGLPPGREVTVALAGDYASPPMGCANHLQQSATVDAGGVATVRFDIPPRHRCRLLASMVARIYVLPDGPDLGPRRFSTLPPPRRQ